MAPWARESEKASEVAARLSPRSWLIGSKNREAVLMQPAADHTDRGHQSEHAPAVEDTRLCSGDVGDDHEAACRAAAIRDVHDGLAVAILPNSRASFMLA